MTTTSAFGAGRREGHDSSPFYARFDPPTLDGGDELGARPEVYGPLLGDARDMADIPDRSVALVVTSPPYFVGKEYENEMMEAARDPLGAGIPKTYREYLGLLHDVFSECRRVMEPGGRIAVNVANLGRKPYRSLSADIVGALENLGFLLRGEIVWRKAAGSSGSCAWGSFRSPSNPVLRDLTERVIVASKGRFDRAVARSERERRGLPHIPTLGADEFMEATLDVWDIPSESARRVGHPAPFPVALPARLIRLYTYEDDLVLDPFMGSGTTLVAAGLSHRRAVGYDIDPAYAEIAEERIAKLSEEDGGHETRVFSGGTKSARAATRDMLEEAGFAIVAVNPATASGVRPDFLVEGKGGRKWYVLVAGNYSAIHPGLRSANALWEMLGKILVLRSSEPKRPIIAVTPALPKRNTLASRRLRSLKGDDMLDLIEIDEVEGCSRLRRYAEAR